MYTTLGISAEQVYGDMFTAWLRDTHEKNTPDVKRLYTAMIENGFGNQQVLLRRQRLGANFINSLVPLLHQSALVKLDLHGNMLRDVGCELLVQVLRDTPCLTHLDLGANAIGSSSAAQAGGGGARAGSAGARAGTRRAESGTAESAAGGGTGSRTIGGGRSTTRGGGANASSSAARTGSRYLTAMQGLGAAIAQHKRLTVLVLGSMPEESYANQIEEAGAVYVLEGCVLSHTLKILDLSGNPLAANCDAPVEAARRVGNTDDGASPPVAVLAAAAAAAAHDGTASGGNPATTTPTGASRVRSGNGAEDGRSGVTSALKGNHAGVGGGGNATSYGTRSGPRTPVELLAQLFRTSTTLTHVGLRAVGLSDSGAAYLLDAAGASRSLLRLDMSENGFSSHVAEAAGQLLQQRTAAIRSGAKGSALLSLVLSLNDLRDNGAAAAVARRGDFGFTTATNGAAATGNGRSGGGGGGVADTRLAASAPASSSRYVTRTRALRDAAGAVNGNSGNGSMMSPGASSGAFYAGAANDSQAGMLLFSALSTDQHLTSLVLDGCVLDDAALFALCRSLLTNTCLTVLSLRDNEFTPDGVVQLGRALCRHPCLEKLFLSGNAVEDEGACALATALGYPEASLMELDVAGTWLGDRGLIALGVALQTNTSLRVLHVADNHFTQDGGASFAALLENNQHVVRCELSGTSVPHHVVLRLERATTRNRRKADNAESDALKKEVVRLHYQKYKLSEAQLELESLREKNADVKRTTENFDTQTKQGHNDFMKRIRELEDQIGNAKQQEGRYVEQAAKLTADLAKAQESHADEMTFATERLAVEARLREEAEAEFHATQAELEDWRQNGAAREAKKRETLAEMKADQEAWAAQRKDYRERTAEVQQAIAELEAGGAVSKK